NVEGVQGDGVAAGLGGAAGPGDGDVGGLVQAGRRLQGQDVGQARGPAQPGDDGDTRGSRRVALLQRGGEAVRVVAQADVRRAGGDGRLYHELFKNVKRTQRAQRNVVPPHEADDGVMVVGVGRFNGDVRAGDGTSTAPGARLLLGRQRLLSGPLQRGPRAPDDSDQLHAWRDRQLLRGPAAHVAAAPEDHEPHQDWCTRITAAVAGLLRSRSSSSDDTGCGLSRSPSTMQRKPYGSSPSLTNWWGVMGGT